MRIKAMQQVVDSQASRIAALAAEKEVAALGHQDEYTGQGEGNKVCVYWPCIQTFPYLSIHARNMGRPYDIYM